MLLAIPLRRAGDRPGVLADRRRPVAGFPFFYWYQLVWVILTPILTWTAYLLIKKGRS